MTQLCDDSGFEVSFEDDTPESERKFYMKAFPVVDSVAERRIHCTTCNGHIGTAPVTETKIRMHPVLRVTICRSCHTFYNSGEFEKGEDGSELYCRWCGQGGEVYCCANCPYVFCKKCIIQNLSRATVQDIERTDNWACFSCSPQILFHLRAQHWALTNFVEKQLKEILSSGLNEEQVNERMNKDLTSCCNHRKKVEKKTTILMKPKQIVGPASKKRPVSPLAGPASKKSCSVLPASAILNGQVPKTSNDVVCTPDIMSMFMDDSPSAASTPAPAKKSTPHVTTVSLAAAAQAGNRPVPPLTIRQYGGPGQPASMQPRPATIVRTPTYTAAGPMVLNQASVMQQIRPNPSPVYHTINGFRIDLNSAAQQDTFRLPNGKLIQVKKQIPLPSQPPQAQVRAQTQIQPRPSNPTMLSVRYPNTAIPHLAPPQLLNGIRQQAQAPVPQMQFQASAIRPTGLSLKPQAPVLNKPNHPPTPLGTARNAFEFKVYNSLEICHQIICKINILSNNSSYKNVRHLKDLKELYIHLSYLLTYAQGRFKAVQDKCAEELKNLGFEDAKEDAKDFADGDVEVIDTPAPLIEIDSDDEAPQPPVTIPTVTITKEPIPSTSKEPELPVIDVNDPKLMLRPRIRLQRLETIRPEVIAQLKKIKAEKTDTPSTSKAADSTQQKPASPVVATTETLPQSASNEVDSSSKNDSDDKDDDMPLAKRVRSSTEDAEKTSNETQDDEVQSSDAPKAAAATKPSTSQETAAQVKPTASEADSSKEPSTNHASKTKDNSRSPAQDNQVSSANSKAIIIDDDIEMLSADDPLSGPTSTSGKEKATTSAGNLARNVEVVALESDDDDEDGEVVAAIPEKKNNVAADSSSEKGNEPKKQDEVASTSSPGNVVASSADPSEVVESSQEKSAEIVESSTKPIEIDDDDEEPNNSSRQPVSSEAVDEPQQSDETMNDDSEQPQQSDDTVNEVHGSDDEQPQQSDEPMNALSEEPQQSDEPMHDLSEEPQQSDDPTVESHEEPQQSDEPMNDAEPQSSAVLNENAPQSSNHATQSSDVTEPQAADAPQSSDIDEPDVPESSANVDSMDAADSNAQQLPETSSTEKPESNEADSQLPQESIIDTISLPDPFDGQPESSTMNGSPKVSESQITLEDVDVDLFQSAADDPQKNDLNIDDLIAESDLAGLDNFDQDTWNI